MAVVQLFNFHDIVPVVAKYFERKGFEVRKNILHEGMKVHIYAKKKEKGKDEDAIVEIAVAENIPELYIGNNLDKTDDGDEIIGLLTHFQIYFHPSKIYLAIPHYASNISAIKDLCRWEGIGLLEIKDNSSVKELLPAFDRVSLLREVMKDQISPQLDHLEGSDAADIIENMVDLSDSLLLHRAVTTLAKPPPSYQMNLSRNLLERMHYLSSDVIYKDDILSFYQEYQTKRVDDYDIVVKYVKILWENHLAFKKITSSFDFYEKFENILMLDMDYRDHFLHQFQVFLLGTLIIDGIFDKYFKCYKVCHHELTKKCVFESWLMASTFHDFAYPLERYSNYNDEIFKLILNTKKSPTITGFEKITTEKYVLEYLDQIDSLLKCYTSERVNWQCKSPHTTNEELRRFLLNKIVHEKNHGVLSGLSLLIKSEKESIDENIVSCKLYPAALAISIHDEGIWQPLRGKKPSWRGGAKVTWEEEFRKIEYMNHLDFSMQPLSFMLIYCDTAQEFGRPKYHKIKDDSKSKVQFEGIVVDKEKIQIIISVETTKEYEKKKRELNDTIDFLKCSDIEFSYRLENREDKTGRTFVVTT